MRLSAALEEQKARLAEQYETMKATLTRIGSTGSGRATHAEDLARAFARLLGIPDGRAELGYRYISQGEAPEEFARLVSP